MCASLYYYKCMCSHSNCIVNPQGQDIISHFFDLSNSTLITAIDWLTGRLADLAIALTFYAYKMC